MIDIKKHLEEIIPDPALILPRLTQKKSFSRFYVFMNEV